MDEKKTNKDQTDEFAAKVLEDVNETLYYEDSLMDDDAKEEVNVETSDTYKNSNKARLSKLPWLISIFLILAIAIFVGIMFLKNNPKTIFTVTVDNLFNVITSNINDNAYDIVEGNVNLDYEINSKIDSEMFEELSKIVWNIDYVTDNSNERTHLDVQTEYDDQDFVNFDIYSDKDDMYVYPMELFDKYIRIPDYTHLNLSNGAKSIKSILNGLNQAIDKVVAAEKITGGKETITVNDEKVKVYVANLVIDDNNRNRILETLMNTLKANDEVVQALAKVKGVTVSDVKAAMDRYLPDIKNYFESLGNVDINLYIENSTNEFVKAEFLSDRLNIELVNNGKNEYSYMIDSDDLEVQISGVLAFNVNDDKSSYDVNITFDVKNGVIEIMDGSIDLKVTSKQANSFDNVDVSNNIDVSALTDIDKFNIYTNIVTDNNRNAVFKVIPGSESWFNEG